jgi:hypothetical protein
VLVGAAKLAWELTVNGAAVLQGNPKATRTEKINNVESSHAPMVMPVSRRTRRRSRSRIVQVCSRTSGRPDNSVTPSLKRAVPRFLAEECPHAILQPDCKTFDQLAERRAVASLAPENQDLLVEPIDEVFHAARPGVRLAAHT